MTLPKPDFSRIREFHKLSKTTLGPQDANGNQAYFRRSLGTSSRALEVFLLELRNTLPEHRRPFIVNLNGDGAILISIPRPLAEAEAVNKAFYYIVTDPWLTGPAHFFDAPDFIISLRHLEPEAYRSIGAVELLIRAIENATLGHTDNWVAPDGPDGHVRSAIDAFIVSNQLADHAHRPTLQVADDQTPILAAGDAVPILKSWDHFENIWPIPNLNVGNKSPLPPWLNVMRLPAGQQEVSHGILVSWASKPTGRPEAILYAPHGVALETVEPVLVGTPTLQLLALLHPVNETITEGGPDSLGVDTGLELYRGIAAKYWVQIHDPDMQRTGLLAPFQEFRERSLDEALEANPGPRPTFRERANGDIFVLA